MHDDFLHRLRKEPRPAFATRLRAQLAQQSARRLRPRAPSRLRTFITLLLLGGTAFAVTFVVMKGLPESLLELYQHAAGPIAGEPTATGTRSAGKNSMREGLQWGGMGSSSPNGAAPRSGPGHFVTQTMNPPRSAAPTGGPSGGSSQMGGALPTPQEMQLRLVTSWSAYAYTTPVAGQMNVYQRLRIDVSVRDSSQWPGPMCAGGASAPDLAYAFEPIGTVADPPCPGGAPAKPQSIAVIHLGYEAVVLARSPLYGELDLTRREVFLALAKWVPDAHGETVHENTSTTWRQINAAMGPELIEFMGPPLSSAAGRSVIELLMEGGCKTFPWIAALESTDPDRYDRICRTVREDAVYVEVSGLAPSSLLAEPNAVGIFGFPRRWGVPLGDLVVSRLDGIKPTLQAIESGAYPGSRGFYVYVNRNYVNRGRIQRKIIGLLLMNEVWRSPVPSALVPISVYPPDTQTAITKGLGP